jgi:carbon storage regulator
MLLISRRVGESIIINKNIKITFLRVNSPGQISIGIDAPPEVPVNREEIHERIKREDPNY